MGANSANRSLVFVKQILRQIYIVSVMANLCKHVYCSIIHTGHQVVHYKTVPVFLQRKLIRKLIVKLNATVVIKYVLILSVPQYDSLG